MREILRGLSASVLAIALASAVIGAGPARAADRFYLPHNLVSDGSAPADHVDPNLINPWGIAINPNGIAWLADNHTGLSTLYDGAGVAQPAGHPLIVVIPPPGGGGSSSAPTGVVFSGGSDFVVSKDTASAPSRFIFATEDGTISGWAPTVDATNAILEVNNSGSGTVYKGLALGGNGIGHLLYATDFHNNRIDVFDDHFQPVTVPGGFTDPHLPRHYGPFGIQNIGGNLYVTYAKQKPGAVDDQAGLGLGLVDVFDGNGRLIRRFASRGKLNAPWGVALAPANFGPFSDRVLIGNFGDGKIDAYDLATGEFRGQLHRSLDHVLAIDGLWGIAFGNGILGQPTNALFFTAGPGEETHGIYGRIDAVQGHGDDDDDDDR